MVRSIAIGPANYAGQAALWAQSVRRFSDMTAISFGYDSDAESFGFETEFSLGGFGTLSLPDLKPFLNLVSATDVVALDGFVSVNGNPRIANIARQARKARGRGVEVLMISHGTDTRNPDLHMSRVEDSYYLWSPKDFVDGCRKKSARNREIVKSTGCQLLVSTPDLLLDNPGATWLPVVVDGRRWVGARADPVSRCPRVLHVPSRSVPPIKGSAFIDPVLSKLAGEGIIEYVRPERMKHSEMPGLVASVDIVVDQIQTGSYGVAAVEAMFAGRIVVGYVAADVREMVPREIPIVDAPPSVFEEKIRNIAGNLEEYLYSAQDGPRYAADFHSGRVSAKVIESACSAIGSGNY